MSFKEIARITRDHFENIENNRRDQKVNPRLSLKTEIANGNKKELKELNETEKECQEFIEAHKRTVSDALTDLVKEKQFILVGEHHTGECEPIRNELCLALIKLQKAGLTHIALEADAAKQEMVDSFNFSDSEIKQVLKKNQIGGVGWGDGNYDILVMAKQLGIKVILINHDDRRPDNLRGTAAWQNERELNMVATIEASIDQNSKVLIFIGSGHVHKKSVTSYADSKVVNLGERLSEQYGNNAVSSIRHLGQSDNFDGLSPTKSTTPTVERVSNGKREVVILPDSGPIKGDARVTAADYIITVI